MLSVRTPNAVTLLAIVVPLTAFGTVEAILHLKKYFGRTLRRLISIVDPIVPTQKEIATLLKKPIRIDQVEEHIKEDHEKQPVVEGAERYIQWNDSSRKEKTPVCVVFLHGWSACRQEGRPVAGPIAKLLHANLYCGRLPGHGRQPSPKEGWSDHGARASPDGQALLQEAKPRELLLSALDSLRVGLALGDRVVLVGISTGGVLATWLASLLLSGQVDDDDDDNETNNDSVTTLRDRLSALVLISPAYALGHPLYPVLKHSFAALRVLPFVSHYVRSKLIGTVIGAHRNIPAMNEDHYKYATLQYPMAAVLHLLDTLYEMETINYGSITLPTLMVGNPEDPVVNFRVKAANTFLKFGDAPNKVLYCLTRGEHKHIISTGYASPSTVDEITNIIRLFLGANGIVAPHSPAKRNEELKSSEPELQGATVEDYTIKLELGHSTDDSHGKQLARSESPSKGLGSFASYPSFGDLTKPVAF